MGAPVTLVDPNGAYVDASGGGSGTSEVEVTNFPATQPVTGPLTDAELRATPVPVSGTVSVSGTSEVEVTNFPATQPVSGTVSVSGSVAVTGPLTDAELRATPVPVSGPLTNAQLTSQGLLTSDQFTGCTGLLSASPYSDDTGAGDGSVIGLLKGIYVQNAQIIALLTQIETNTGA